MVTQAPNPSPLEKNVVFSAKNVCKGLTAAPKPSPPFPCCQDLPYWLSMFIDFADQIAKTRSLSVPTYLRLEHRDVLDAVVKFANSPPWSREERESYERHRCQCVGMPDVKTFSDGVCNEARSYCPGYGPLNQTVGHVFIIIADVAISIKDNHEAIRLERNPTKRKKWPSSSSEFIPRGADAAVSAFVNWARIMDDATPLRALCQLTSCCPSLEPAMTKNESLLPLIATIFSSFVNRVQRALRNSKLSIHVRQAIEEDIMSFFHTVNAHWFAEQVHRVSEDETAARALWSIYKTISEFLAILDSGLFIFAKFPAPDTCQKVKDRFGTMGIEIHCAVSTTSKINPTYNSINLAFAPYIRYRQEKRTHRQVTELCIDIVSLRDQPSCARVSCRQTTEETKTNFKLCSACKAVRYCSKECQSADWKEGGHKKACKGLKVILPISFNYRSADSLEPAEELLERFNRELQEGGLADSDLSLVKGYVASHAGGVVADQGKRAMRAYEEPEDANYVGPFNFAHPMYSDPAFLEFAKSKLENVKITESGSIVYG